MSRWIHRRPSYCGRPALAVALVLPLLVLAGCDGGETTDTGGTTTDTTTATESQEGLLDAQITGSPTGKAAMLIEEVPATYAEYRDTASGERISIHGNIPGTSEGFQKGDQSLRIFLQPYTGTGTYTFEGDQNVGGAYAEQDATHSFYAEYGEGYTDHGSGSITIDARDEKRISGSFSFTAEDDAKTASVTVTGTFDLPLLPDDG
jgi:hypothetical protein